MNRRVYRYREPTSFDVKVVFELPNHIHKIEEIGGHIDYMYIFCNNCPTVWQSDFAEAKVKPLIILEATCDYHLWFWHSF